MKKFRYLIIALILILDYLLKFLIRETMYCGQSVEIIEDFFSITYVQNRGAAFSLFSGREILIILVPALALCFAVWYMENHKDDHWTLLLAMELIISGGFGNLIDRLRFGFVTDMFDFNFWPVFNVADIAICVGCGFLVLFMFVFDKSDKKKHRKIHR